MDPMEISHVRHRGVVTEPSSRIFNDSAAPWRSISGSMGKAWGKPWKNHGKLVVEWWFHDFHVDFVRIQW